MKKNKIIFLFMIVFIIYPVLSHSYLNVMDTISFSLPDVTYESSQSSLTINNILICETDNSVSINFSGINNAEDIIPILSRQERNIEDQPIQSHDRMATEFSGRIYGSGLPYVFNDLTAQEMANLPEIIVSPDVNNKIWMDLTTTGSYAVGSDAGIYTMTLKIEIEEIL